MSPGPSFADVSSSNQAEAAASFQAVDALARQTRARGDLPRWSSRQEAAVLKRFWDVPKTLGASPYTSNDVPALLTIADRAGALYKTYLLFSPQAGALPDTTSNTAKYQDEISRAVAYLLRVQSAELEAMTDFVKALPAADMNAARRAGMKQVHLGINEMITNAILMIRSPGLQTANRDILLAALQDSANLMAASTPKADRMALVAQIDTIIPALDDQQRPKALAVKSAFEQSACSPLCALDEQ